ncbi:MAG: hypothetical protein AAGD22_03715 [Verrucomicrobiota bacterium]
MQVLERTGTMIGSEWEVEDTGARRISEPMDFGRIERGTGEWPWEVEATEGAHLIAEHYIRVDRDVRNPMIARRLRERMKEHCSLVGEQAGLHSNETIFYCPERKKFFAYRYSERA